MHASDADVPDDDADVLLVTNAELEVDECVCSRTGASLTYAYVLRNSVPHQRFVRRAIGRTLHAAPRTVSQFDPSPEIGPPATPVGDKDEEAKIHAGMGSCHVLDPFETVKVDTRSTPFGAEQCIYAQGLLAVELTGMDEDRVRELAFDMETAFGVAGAGAGAMHVHPPGLIMRHDEYDDLREAVSPFAAAVDPLLTRYEAGEWRTRWGVGMSPTHYDFVGVFKSDWSGVAADVCANQGHEMGIHYYAVVHAGLAEQTAEQLMWLLRRGARSSSAGVQGVRDGDGDGDDDGDGDGGCGASARFRGGPRTWEELAESDTLRVAADMARHARSTLLERLLDVLQVGERGERIETEYNVLRATNFRRVVGSTGDLDSRTAFYEMCASSAASERGVLMMSRPDAPEDGIVWLHGAPFASRIGGGPWSHSETADAVPVFLNREFSAGNSLESLERFGYRTRWGKAVLRPVVVVRSWIAS